MGTINEAIDKIYETFDGPGDMSEYHKRHDTQTLAVLTVTSPAEAAEVVAAFADDIRGRTVIEIGAGIGFLSLELAKHARQVWAIEVDVAWSWAFMRFLYRTKPPNLTWIFGGAESVADYLRADVAVLRTRSGVRRLVSLAERMADTIILSACTEPLICAKGERLLHDIAEFVDRRCDELTVEAMAAVAAGAA